MARAGTASLTIAELREFASFTEAEQLFIERGLDIGLGRGDAFKLWSCGAGDKAAIRQQYLAYRELRALRVSLPAEASLDGLQDFMGPLLRITAQDLAQERLDSFSAYRFLYERLLGAKARPWLPAAFCGAAALEHAVRALDAALCAGTDTAGACAEFELRCRELEATRVPQGG